MNPASIFHQYSILVELTPTDLPRPTPEEGRAVVKINAIGLNPCDPISRT